MFDFYGNAVYNYFIWGSLAFFFIFLCVVLFFKLGSGRDCIARLNKINAFFSLVYVAAGVVALFHFSLFDIQGLCAFLTGIFVFLTLHYIGLMGIIGLIKKSVSVNILSDMVNDPSSFKNGGMPAAYLSRREDIISNRLEQMKFLGFVSCSGGKYIVTGLGGLASGLADFFLSAWGLKRL